MNLYHEEGLRGFVFLCAFGGKQRISSCETSPEAGGERIMRKRNYMKAARSSKTARRKKVLITAGVLLGMYLLASFILGEMGLVKYYRMKAQYHDLTEEIAHLQQDNAKLTRDVRSLKSDPACIERIARDKLGLARPGEIVYYYENADRLNYKSQKTPK
jgi:cell division protein FtsB